MELPELKLGESKEITNTEYNLYIDYFYNKSVTLSNMYEDFGYKKITETHFFHCSVFPCVYSSFELDRKNPKTGRTLKRKPLPKGFRSLSKEVIYHFSPVGCPGLVPFYSVVWCLAKVLTNREETEETEVKRKYYISYHRVGECPFKEVGE